MQTQNKLIALIQSISKMEAQAFNQSYSSPAEKPKYMLLFNLLKREPDLSNEILQKKLNVKQVSRLKNYLFSKLIEFLLASNKHRFNNLNVEENLTVYHLLYERNLPNIAKQYAHEAEKKIEENHLLEMQWKTLEFKVREAGETPFSKQYEQKIIPDLKNKFKEQLKILKLRTDLKSIFLDIMLEMKKNGFDGRSNPVKNLIKSNIDEINSSIQTLHLSPPLKYEWINLQFFFAYWQFDKEACSSLLLDLWELFKTSNIIINQSSNQLETFLLNASTIFMLVNQPEAFEKIIQWFKQNKNIQKYHPILDKILDLHQYDFLTFKYTFPEYIFQSDNDLHQLVENKKHLESQVNYNKVTVGIIYFRMSFIALMNKQNEDSIEWANLVTNQFKDIIPPYIYYYAFFIELLAQWRLENHLYVSNKVIYLSNLLQRVGFLGEYEKLGIKLLKELNSLALSKRKKVLISYLSKFKNILKSEGEKHKTSNFNFVFWIETELKHLS